jgi:hypothetical protein
MELGWSSATAVDGAGGVAAGRTELGRWRSDRARSRTATAAGRLVGINRGRRKSSIYGRDRESCRRPSFFAVRQTQGAPLFEEAGPGAAGDGGLPSLLPT